MKGLWIVLGAAIAVALLMAGSVTVVDSEEAQTAEMPAGQKAFVAGKCNTCHSVDAASIAKKMASSKAPDLSTVGSTRDAEWLTRWLNKEVDLEGKKHPAAWKGTPEDLKAVVDWMGSLKKKE